MDSIDGVAGFEFNGSKMVIIDLRVDYLHRAKPCAIIVEEEEEEEEEEVLKNGNRILITTIYPWYDYEDNLLAKGRRGIRFHLGKNDNKRILINRND